MFTTSAPEELPLAVSIIDAAELLSVGRSTIYSLLDSGKIRSVKVGTRRLIPRDELLNLLHDTTTTQTPAPASSTEADRRGSSA